MLALTHVSAFSSTFEFEFQNLGNKSAMTRADSRISESLNQKWFRLEWLGTYTLIYLVPGYLTVYVESSRCAIKIVTLLTLNST